jgi:hypothetical protein
MCAQQWDIRARIEACFFTVYILCICAWVTHFLVDLYQIEENWVHALQSDTQYRWEELLIELSNTQYRRERLLTELWNALS